MHFDQNIIFIIIAAIVGISRLIARIAEKSGQQQQRKAAPRARPQPTAQSIQRTQPKTDEERVREFLEALGQAPGSLPPPKVQPRTSIPPRPVAPIQPPPLARPFSTVLARTPAEKKKTIVVPQEQPTRSWKREQVVVIPATSVAPVAVNEPGAWVIEEQAVSKTQTGAGPSPVYEMQSPRASADTVWKQTLRSPDAVRAAIVLREIFGPPRAMQPVGLDSSGA